MSSMFLLRAADLEDDDEQRIHYHCLGVKEANLSASLAFVYSVDLAQA